MRRQQENGLTEGDGSPAQEEGWTAGIRGVCQPQELRTSVVIRQHWGVLPSKSAGHPLSSLQRTPFLPSHSPSQVAIGASVGTGRCPPGERQTGPQHSRNRTAPALPLPAITTSPEASEVPGHLAAGYFLPPQSELLRGLWLEERCPTIPHPHLPLHLCGREARNSLYILGIGFNFLNCILIIFFLL